MLRLFCCIQVHYQIIVFFSQHIMMKRSRLKEHQKIVENIIKNVRNIFILKKVKNKKQVMLQLKV